MEIKERIKNRIAQILGISPDSFGYDTEAGDISAWDSMNNVIILSTLEEEFEVEFPEEDLFDLVSVESIACEILKLKS